MTNLIHLKITIAILRLQRLGGSDVRTDEVIDCKIDNRLDR